MNKIKDLRYDIKSCQSVSYDHNDYIKVVRCKDCQFFDKAHYCYMLMEWLDENNYCSRGKSKDER